jgi:hypothetical protein
MSVSLPSKEIYTVDVPEVKNFKATFHYNFFTPDEQVKESSGIPQLELQRIADDSVDAFNSQYLTTRVPRYVAFSWNKPRLQAPGGQLIESDVRKHSQRPPTLPRLIADNLDKIVDEDHFSSYNYLAVTFHDGSIDDKVYNFVSGSYEQLTLETPKDPGLSVHKASLALQRQVPSRINPHFISRAMIQPHSAFGARHYDAAGGVTMHTIPGAQVLYRQYFNRLKHVYLHSQINSKLFHDVTNRVIKDPHSTFPLDAGSLHFVSRKLGNSVKKRLNLTINDEEFKVIVPYVNLRVDPTSHHVQRMNAELVGFIIDKYEIADDGSVKQLQPIIVEHPEVHRALDVAVKYNQQYSYTIRTIALFHLPAIDHDTGDIATIQVLVSSKPSNKVDIKIVDDTAPPPPSDINFVWNYETEKLMMHWAFPPNSQRDVKRFQVFRRVTTDQPFELLKEYDFDDSAVRADDHERPEPHLVEHLTSPCRFYVDDDFTKSSKYIYTVCCIDAHGLTSCYGAQFQLSFDVFKNQLVKSLISHAGAPKPYPNLYLEGEGFVNVARVSGPHSKTLRLFFNPEYYILEDDQERAHRILSTKQTHGSYVFQFINADNQKSQKLTVAIDDRVRAAQPKLTFPKFVFNVPKQVKG